MSEPGAGGDGDKNKGGDVDYSKDPNVQKLINDAVTSATLGLKTKNDEILAEKKDLANKMAELEKQWSGFDAKQIANLMDKITNDEETKLIAEGKIDEVIEKRVEALKRDYEGKLSSLTEKLSEFEGQVGAKDSKIKKLVVDGHVRQAASKLGVVPTAIDDVIYRAAQTFALDDNDNPVAKNSDGAIIFGKSGKDPLTAVEWLESMKEKAPHWFPGSQGAGAAGGKDGKGGSYTITKADAANPQAYQAAKEAAAKAGHQLQIVQG